jgi:hypothetical protein
MWYVGGPRPVFACTGPQTCMSPEPSGAACILNTSHTVELLITAEESRIQHRVVFYVILVSASEATSSLVIGTGV